MENKLTWFALSIASLLVAIATAAYMFSLGVASDTSATEMRIPIWSMVLASAALLFSFLAFVRGARLLAEQANNQE